MAWSSGSTSIFYALPLSAILWTHYLLPILVSPILSDFHPFIKDFGIPTDTYVDPCTFHLSILWTVRPPLFLNVSQIIVMLLYLCVQRGILFVTTNRMVLRRCVLEFIV